MSYVETFDADEQISAEEQIAAIIFEGADSIDEETAGELGRTILLAVLTRFRPDLIE